MAEPVVLEIKVDGSASPPPEASGSGASAAEKSQPPAAEKRIASEPKRTETKEPARSKWASVGKAGLSAALTAYSGGGFDASFAASAINPYAAGAVKATQALGNKIAPYSGSLSSALAFSDINRENAFARAGQKLGPAMGSLVESSSRIETTLIDSLTTLLKPVLDALAPVLEIVSHGFTILEPVVKLLSIVLKPLELFANVATPIAEKFGKFMDEVVKSMNEILAMLGLDAKDRDDQRRVFAFDKKTGTGRATGGGLAAAIARRGASQMVSE